METKYGYIVVSWFEERVHEKRKELDELNFSIQRREQEIKELRTKRTALEIELDSLNGVLDELAETQKKE